MTLGPDNGASNATNAQSPAYAPGQRTPRMEMKMILNLLKKALGKPQVLDFDPAHDIINLLPNGIDFPVLLADAKRDLQDSHAEYTSTVSVGSSAASLELAALLAALCRVLQPRRLVDLGSGYTSYVLRSYAKSQATPVDVTSVDDSADWLARTREYLEAAQLDTSNLMTWDTFEASGDTDFDLVVLDVRPIARRVEHLPRLMRGLRPGGMIIVDDVHKPHLSQPLIRMAKEHHWFCAGLKSLTLDGYQRFAAVVAKEPA